MFNSSWPSVAYMRRENSPRFTSDAYTRHKSLKFSYNPVGFLVSEQELIIFMYTPP